MPPKSAPKKKVAKTAAKAPDKAAAKKTAAKRTSPKGDAKTKLAKYRAMRDFGKTEEPSGERAVARSKHLRFVVQKHAATRLHYDFRLEYEGVFLSWAVTRGPSLDPADKRLAVRTEDHPLDYGDFEGTIPKGEYGGGTVMLWDRGFWAPEPGFEPEKALKKGELKFVVAGEKLKGGWVLVRLKRREGEKRDNWLLIKHRDDYSVDGHGDQILGDDTSVASGRTLDQIAAGKGRKPKPFMLDKTFDADAVWRSSKGAADNVERAAANDVVKGKPLQALPDFVVPQFCRVAEKPPSGPGWGYEIKFDGYRMQLHVEKGKAKLFTRKGLDWTAKFRSIADSAAKHLKDGIYDGEVCAVDQHGAPRFDTLQAAIANGKTQDLIFFAFDLIAIGKEDLRALPLSARKERLKAELADAPAQLRYVSHFESNGEAVLAAAKKMDLEGIIAKRLDRPYRAGSRDDWVKIKSRPGHEVVIGGWTEEGERFRSLLVGTFSNGKLVYGGRVGTGFNAKSAQDIAAKLRKIEIKQSPFAGPTGPARERGLRWVNPELVAEIEFAGWTDAGNVRQASFKGLREDKPAGEVEAEAPMPAKTAKAKSLPAVKKPLAKRAEPAKRLAATSKAGRPTPVLGVTISNPDKVLWPPEKGSAAFSKLDLAHYYEAVGDWMLEHVRGRPCSIIRAPDGIKAELFFQRHAMQGASPLITQVKTPGDKKPYIQFDSVAAIVAAGQIGAVELHPWNCQPGLPEVPGRLVFDLDPAPELPFERVIEAAKEMRDRLEKLGLVGFCKTTGGKGLHVVTPFKLSKDLRWPEAKGFAMEVCRQMAADSPDLYLINMSKKERVGKIFLDYLRNDATSTAVAPLSPRARPGAPVSMPLTWSQVRSGLDPQRFTLATVPALLAKSKAWAEYCDSERPFHPAAKKLIGKRGR